MTDSIETSERDAVVPQPDTLRQCAYPDAALPASKPPAPYAGETIEQRARYALANPDIQHSPADLREIIGGLLKSLDEADRRAGAAERANASLLDAAGARSSWLYKAKRAWGVDDVVSFDVVWAEALQLKRDAARGGL